MQTFVHNRQSLRLKGFRYDESGAYFVTVCTAGRLCTLGNVIEGRMQLSPAGQIVQKCWDAIPEHFPNARTGGLQVMPNHLHGIVEILHGGAQHAAPLHMAGNLPQPGSLGAIVRSFKSAVTKEIHAAMAPERRPIWQRSFYDRIIWDRNNIHASRLSIKEMKQELMKRYGLDAYSGESLLEDMEG